ncbi:MAG: hypothetical protein DWQ09_04570 [Proteobacteria bacterium]|nr:MAG: hypothetical protein DWQ09_04570 [Pseudomonadota bacterium]
MTFRAGRWARGVFIELMPRSGQQPAPPRSEYHPVFPIEPCPGNEEALDFGLASNTERRRALAEARDSADLTVSAALRRVQGQGAVVD